MNFIIDRNKFKTEKGKQLYDMLKVIWNNDEWIAGVISNVKGDKKKQKLINALESNLQDYKFSEDLTEYTDKIVDLSLAIADDEI